MLTPPNYLRRDPSNVTDDTEARHTAHTAAGLRHEEAVLRTRILVGKVAVTNFVTHKHPFWRISRIPLVFHARARGRRVAQLEPPAGKCCWRCSSADQGCSYRQRPAHDPPLAACAGRKLGTVAASFASFAGLERPSQARFGGLTLLSRAPWLLVTGAPGSISWPKTLWNTASACRMSPTSRTGQAAASRRHRHRNRRGAAGARRWATHARMDAT